MGQVTFVGAGDDEAVWFESGDILMVTAVRNMILGIEAQCGGAAACGTCQVEIDARWRHLFPDPDTHEQDMLDAVAEDRPYVRLSCQLRLDERHDGMHVHVVEAGL